MKSSPRILLYGFKPFKSYRENITEIALSKINRKNIVKKVFDVVFEREQFTYHLEAVKADIVLGTGQCSRGQKIRIERKAFNIRSDTSGLIKPDAPDYMFSTLNIKHSPETRYSYNAGRYVCNFSMYTYLDFIQEQRLNCLYTFLHIPRHLEPDYVRDYLVRCLDELSYRFQL